MAAYNADRFVEQALASLSAQTLPDLEVLVADDGSKDTTATRVEAAARRDARIRLLRLRENQGQATALNTAVAEARGEYLAFLDADDEAAPTRLADQVAALEREPDLLLVGGAVRTFRDGRPDEGTTWRYATQDPDIRVRNLFKSEFISGAMTFRRRPLVAHGLRYDPRIRLGNDWDLSSRALRVGLAANLPQVVLHYRLHGAQMTAGMMDDLTFDSARIRREALSYAALSPSDDELRTHLAISPCNYWPFGTHPFFIARGPAIADDARRWFERLRAGVARRGRIPLPALDTYLDEIAEAIDRCLATGAGGLISG